MANTARATAKLVHRVWRSERAHRRNNRGQKQEKKRAQRNDHSEPTGSQPAYVLTLLVLTAVCFFVGCQLHRGALT